MCVECSTVGSLGSSSLQIILGNINAVRRQVTVVKTLAHKFGVNGKSSRDTSSCCMSQSCWLRNGCFEGCLNLSFRFVFRSHNQNLREISARSGADRENGVEVVSHSIADEVLWIKLEEVERLAVELGELYCG